MVLSHGYKTISGETTVKINGIAISISNSTRGNIDS